MSQNLLLHFLFLILVSCDGGEGGGGGPVKETAAPTLTIDNPDPINLATVQNSYQIGGECSENNRKITLTVTGNKGASVPAPSITCTDGDWSARVNVLDLQDGQVAIAANYTDTTDNPVQQTKHTEKDTRAPQLEISSYSNILSANRNSYSMNGRCSERNGQVTVVLTDSNNQTDSPSSPVICTNGQTWSVSGFDVSGLANGSITIEVSQRDTLRNRGVASGTVTKSDKTVSVEITSAPSINTANLESYTLEGNCNPSGGTVTVTIGGQSPTTSCTSGTWQAELNLGSETLADNVAVAVDYTHNGDAASTLNISVIKDTELPIVGLDGRSAGIDRINDSAYTLSGTCSESGEMVEVELQDEEATPNEVSETVHCENGLWQKVLDVSVLQEGSITITVAHTDWAGNRNSVTGTESRDNSVIITLESPPQITEENELNYELSGTCSEEEEEVTVALTDSGSGEERPSEQPTCNSFEWGVNGFDVSSLKDGLNEVQISITHGGEDPLTENVSKGCTAGGGAGASADDPIVICDYTGLKNIASALGKHYVLGKSIDASDSWNEGADGCTAYDGSAVAESNACSGMTPLGTDSTPFTGSFDGNDFEISKLYINVSVIYAGLFGKVDSSETTAIKNVHLRSVLVKNNQADGASNTGGLAGRVNGAVNNCSVTGKVVGKSYAGGLIGQGGKVVNSYADVVVGGGTYFGGLICEGHIYNSYAKGDVSGTYYSGGLAAFSGHIRNSYADVKVSHSSLATSSVLGGLRSGDQTTIHNVYGLGLTIGNHFTTGGVVGSIGSSPHSENSITNAFWNTQTTGVSTSFISGGVTSTVGGLTTEQMQVACPEESTTGICALGDAFVFAAGKYPKVKKCLSNCDSDSATFSNELVGGQEN